MKRLEGRVAVVTGGAGGIGSATVERLASEGATVVAWDRAEAHSDSIAGARVSFDIVDVTDAASVAAALKRVVDTHGRLDILVNNAGIIRDAFAEKLELDDWEAVLRVNLTGTFIPSRAVISHMRERGSGRIISTASTSAFGNRGQSNYAASKAGVIGLTRTLALELAADGITVNCVAPGPIETAMLAKVPEKIRAKLLAFIPMGRFGEPGDIAATHAFLASDDGRYITGQTIVCDGGLTL